MQAMERKEERGRCATGIEGLDSILGGGIPASNLVLVTGGCGTGKTTLALEFLIRGAQKGEKGLLVSTVEAPEKMLAGIPRFDFFDDKLLQDGRLQLVEAGQLAEKTGPVSSEKERGIKMVEEIEKIVSFGGLKRVVIDSISSFIPELGDEAAEAEILKKISRALYAAKCTGIVISDRMDASENAVADGVVVMSNHERRGDLLRTIQVIKMKGTSHSRSKYVIDLTSCGVLITPLLKGGI